MNGPSFFSKYGLAFSADQVADIIEDSSWNHKDVVWLKSCNTGKDPNGFAQQLANRLGVTVLRQTLKFGLISKVLLVRCHG